jgi:septal ring-binding cell division protein DamX
MNGTALETPAHPETSALRVGAALGGIVLSAVIIFGLGVMVGKRVAESGPAFAPPPAALPTEAIPPLPAVDEAPAAAIPPERLTFYDRLSGVAPPPPLPLPEGQPPPQAGASLASAPAPAPAPSAPATASTVPASPREAPAPKTDPETQIKKLAGKGRFAVQVAAVAERTDAEETAARVRRQGFEVVTVMASVKGKVWYRIRVSSFPSKQAATQAAAIFRSAYGYDAIPVQN